MPLSGCVNIELYLSYLEISCLKDVCCSAMGDDGFPRPKDLTKKDISVLLYPAHMASLLVGAFLIESHFD